MIKLFGCPWSIVSISDALKRPGSPATASQGVPLCSPATLIVANAATIVMAMVEGWNLATVLLIYWFQSVTIGFFTVARILMFPLRGIGAADGGFPINGAVISGGWSRVIAALMKVGTAAFFTVHYGLFHLVYLSFILVFWMESGMGLRGIPELLLSCAFFFVTHLYSFLYYRNREESAENSLSEFFNRPYARIIPMHLAIIAGGFVIFFSRGYGLDANRLVVLLFLSLKTLADLHAHQKKHAAPFPQGGIASGN